MMNDRELLALHSVIIPPRPRRRHVSETPFAVPMGQIAATVARMAHLRGRNPLGELPLMNGDAAVGALSALAQEHRTLIKRTLGTLNTRTKATEPLGITLDDLRNSKKEGQWWLVGASWKKNHDSNNPSTYINLQFASDHDKVGIGRILSVPVDAPIKKVI